MRHLTVIYDPGCGFCKRMAEWLGRQPQWIPLRLLPSSMAGKVYPQLDANKLAEELMAISDEGGIYLGDHAWLICLHALKRHRRLAQRLSSPALGPLARQAFKIVSANRHRLSIWLENLTDGELTTELQKIHAPHCHGTNS